MNELFDSLRRTLRDAAARIDVLEATYSDLLAEQKALSVEPMVDASPYWHEDRYLYLIHRTTNGYRSRKYIGNRPERVREALAEIERFKKHAQLAAELERITNRLFDSKFNLQMFASRLNEVGGLLGVNDASASEHGNLSVCQNPPKKITGAAACCKGDEKTSKQGLDRQNG